MGTPSEWEKYSFPKREEHFRALDEEWQEGGDDEDEGEGEEGSGSVGLVMMEAQPIDLWVFDRVSRSIHSSDGRRRIALSKLDTPAKVVRFLVTLEQRSDLDPLPIIRALENAARFIYDQPLTDILSHHAKNSSRIDWDHIRSTPTVPGLS